MTAELRTTPLTDRHVAAGAKLAPFAGWSMPSAFVGTLAEHAAVREHVGVFDVSHLGTVWIRGAGAASAIAATFTNDPARLVDGTSQYTLCCDDAGGIVDDLIIYRLTEERWLAIPNAANTTEVVAALARSAEVAGAQVSDESTGWAIIALQGRDALRAADELVAELGGGHTVSGLDHLGAAEIELAGTAGIVCRTGYTGEPGCEFVVPAAAAGRVWDRAVAGGAEPCGLGARDTLRLEMGYPLHGNELGLDTDPFEARLGWAVALDRAPFRGAAALQRIKEAGVTRRLRGLVADGRRPLRAGLVVTANGEPVGELTSGGFSPSLGRGIGLGFLDRSVAVGDEVTVDVRGRASACEVVVPPFVARDPRG